MTNPFYESFSKLLKTMLDGAKEEITTATEEYVENLNALTEKIANAVSAENIVPAEPIDADALIYRLFGLVESGWHWQAVANYSDKSIDIPESQLLEGISTRDVTLWILETKFSILSKLIANQLYENKLEGYINSVEELFSKKIDFLTGRGMETLTVVYGLDQHKNLLAFPTPALTPEPNGLELFWGNTNHQHHFSTFGTMIIPPVVQAQTQLYTTNIDLDTFQITSTQARPTPYVGNQTIETTQLVARDVVEKLEKELYDTQQDLLSLRISMLERENILTNKISSLSIEIEQLKQSFLELRSKLSSE